MDECRPRQGTTAVAEPPEAKYTGLVALVVMMSALALLGIAEQVVPA